MDGTALMNDIVECDVRCADVTEVLLRRTIKYVLGPEDAADYGSRWKYKRSDSDDTKRTNVSKTLLLLVSQWLVGINVVRHNVEC